MSMPQSRLWVDPEGVTSVGHTYHQHALVYQRHIQHVRLLRAHYAKAWGDDDMGREFSEKFLAGLDALEDLLGGVRGTLEYTSTALRAAGESYRDADDFASGVTRHLGTGLDGSAPAGEKA